MCSYVLYNVNLCIYISTDYCFYDSWQLLLRQQLAIIIATTVDNYYCDRKQYIIYLNFNKKVHNERRISYCFIILSNEIT